MKEKAKELVHKFRMILMDSNSDLGEEVLVSVLSKQCALICVEEIRDVLKEEGRLEDYWIEVEQEIEKL